MHKPTPSHGPSKGSGLQVKSPRVKEKPSHFIMAKEVKSELKSIPV